MRAGAAGGGRRTVLLAFGSNVDPERNLLRALDAVDRALGVEAISTVYEAEPVGAAGTPTFLNAAARVSTDLPPDALKYDVLRPIERRLGRVRGPDPNAPRTADIDIALVDGLVLDDPESGLRLPDPEIVAQAHLALPLADIAPDLEHPEDGRTLARIAARFRGTEGIRPRPELRWPAP